TACRPRDPAIKRESRDRKFPVGDVAIVLRRVVNTEACRVIDHDVPVKIERRQTQRTHARTDCDDDAATVNEGRVLVNPGCPAGRRKQTAARAARWIENLDGVSAGLDTWIGV